MNKKMRRKNQIPKYHTLSSMRLMRIIYEQLIDKKPLNPVEY